MRDDENQSIRRPATHRVGEPLDDCSLDDLAARIALLQAEIARIEGARTRKQAAFANAGSVFNL